MSWFRKLFSTAKSDVETLADHIENEFTILEKRVSAIEQHLIGGTPLSVPPKV